MPSTEVRKWLIQVWDGQNLLFEKRVGFSSITEHAMKHLLRALVSKFALDGDEIVSSYAKKGTKVHADYLEVTAYDQKTYKLSCGSNPFAIATIEKSQ